MSTNLSISSILDNSIEQHYILILNRYILQRINYFYGLWNRKFRCLIHNLSLYESTKSNSTYRHLVLQDSSQYCFPIHIKCWNHFYYRSIPLPLQDIPNKTLDFNITWTKQAVKSFILSCSNLNSDPSEIQIFPLKNGCQVSYVYEHIFAHTVGRVR